MVRLTGRAEPLMKGAFDRLGLTARSMTVSCGWPAPIAYLDGSEMILAPIWPRSIQYRASNYL